MLLKVNISSTKQIFHMLKNVVAFVVSICIFCATIEFSVFAVNEKKVYLDTNAEYGFPHISVSSSNKEVVGYKYKDDEKLYYFHAALLEGEDGGYGDMDVEIDDISQYVYQVDVFPNLTDAGAHLGFIIHSKTKYCRLLWIKSDGTLMSGDTEICVLPMNSWSTIAIACDLSNGEGTVFVNGKMKKNVSLEQGGLLPTHIRIGMDTPATHKQTSEIWINRLKIYEGLELRSFNDVGYTTEILDYPTLNDTEADVIGLLEDDIVFMTSCGYYFLQGKKNKYTSEMGSAYRNKEGVVMVPSQLLGEALDVIITYSNGTIFVDEYSFDISGIETPCGQLETNAEYREGILYLPAISFAKIFSLKYTYEDVRGFVLISDTDREYKNSEQEIENQEPIDIIYRFMQYERPSGEQIYNDMQNFSGEAYPRLFVKKSEMSVIAEKLEKDDELYRAFYGDETEKGILWHCDNAADNIPAPIVKYLPSSDPYFFSEVSRLREKIMDWATAYYVTEDEKYLKRMWEEVKLVLEWPSWNVIGSYLYTGKMAVGIALAYDVLHDYLNDADRVYFKEKVIDLYMNYAIGTYSGTSDYSAKHFKLTETNWGACTTAGSLLIALTFMGDEPENSEIALKCKYLAENSLQSLEYSLGHLFPDGCAGEGIEYWSYYTESLCWSINALINACGTDYGLLSTPGFKQIVNEALYLQSNSGAYNYGNYTETALVQLVPEAFLIAKFYNDDILMNTLNGFRKTMGIAVNTHNLLWYNPVLTTEQDTLKTDIVFEGQKIIAMRSPWTDKKGSYVGLRAGFNELNGHFDKGSFVFDCDGERWICDLGSDDYNVEGGYYYKDGVTLYRKKTEGHNCLVINPDKENPGQTREGMADVLHFEAKEKGSIAVLDLKGVYEGQVNKYKRGFYFGENRRSLVVQDEIELTEKDSDIYWFLHTTGNIVISEDGKSAVITKNGKRMLAEFYCDAQEWKLEFWNAEYIYPEMQRGNELDRSSYKKITLIGKASDKLNISVKLSVLDDGCIYDEHNFVPIEEWKIQEGVIKDLDKVHDVISNITSDDEIIEITLGTSPTVQAKLYIAEYNGDLLEKVDIISIEEGTKIELLQNKKYKLFTLDESLVPAISFIEFTSDCKEMLK